MRRFMLVLALITIPGLAIAPSFAGDSAAKSVVRAPTPERTKQARTCTKTKAKKRGKGKKGARITCSKRKGKGSSRTPSAAAAARPTATPTATPTDTHTPTPTAAETLPSVSSLPVRALVAQGYQAGFMVCGLPADVTASFSPNPATSSLDRSSPEYASARTTLTISTPHDVPALTFPLRLYAYYRDPHGAPTSAPPGGQMDPPGATLTVADSGDTTLSAMSHPPAVGFQGCSAVPPGFLPGPTPTPNPDQVTVSAALTNRFPPPGDTEKVYGKIQLGGQPVASVPMTTQWYFYNGIRTCQGTTDASGVASCSLSIPSSLPNYHVEVQVSFLLNGRLYMAYTSFVTQG